MAYMRNRLQFISVAQSYPTLCNPMDCSTPGLPVHHQLPEFTQTHVHWVGDAIQPSHPLSSPSPPAFNHSQHQDLFKWVSSSHQVAKVLGFQPQHQSFQCTFRTDAFRMDWLDLLAVQGTLKSLLQHHSWKASILRRSAFFTVHLSHPYMTTGKTIALTRRTFVGKVMSPLFNMLSRLVIDFLPRRKRLLISWLQSPSAARCSEFLYYRADCKPVILLLKLFHIWALGAPSKLFLLTCPPHSLSTSLLRGHFNMSMYILYFLCPAFKLTLSPRSPGFFHWGIFRS